MSETESEIIAAQPTKRCPKCGYWRPLGEYTKCVSRTDGLSCWCKSCARVCNKNTCAANRAKNSGGKYYDIPGFIGPKPGHRCSSCSEVLSADDFNKNGSAKHDRSHVCKSCTVGTKFRQRTNNIKAYMLMSVRRVAKKRCLPFTITEDDIVVGDVCPVLGIPMFVCSPYARDNSPSIDKIVPEKGYVPGNVCVISYRANRIKNDATLSELELVAEYVRSNLPAPSNQSQSAA